MNCFTFFRSTIYVFITPVLICGVISLQASEGAAKKNKSAPAYDFVLKKNNRLVLTEADCDKDLSQTKIAINGRGIFEASKVEPELSIQAPGRLPKGLASFVSLTKLALNGCQLREIPEEVGTMANLTELDISINPLQRLPNLCLPRLVVLTATHAELTELNASLASLGELHTLLLSRNSLKELPKEVLLIVRLKHLDVSYNSIESLPDLSSLRKLRELNLESNQLKDLPPSLASLSKLQAFIAGENQLSSFPEALLGLKKLEKISLPANQIEQIPEGIISALEFLRELYMDQNPLKNFPFKGVRTTFLRVISIRDTPIGETIYAAQELQQKKVTVHTH